MSDEQFWSKYADRFDELNDYVIGKADMKLVIDEVVKLTDLGNVLELACGSGIYTRVLCNNCDTIVATDYSEAMVKHSKKKFETVENITVEKANAMELEYEPESFDTVYMANLLHIMPDYEKVLEQSCKVLKPGGKLITLDFTTYGMNFINTMILIHKFMKTYGKPDEKAGKSRFSPQDINNLFERHNIIVSDIKLLGLKNKAVLGVGIKE